MDDTIYSLGTRIRQVRKQIGLKQVLFGQRMGVSKSTVINYETGKRIPDAVFLLRLIEEFDIKPQWLLLGVGRMKGKSRIDPEPGEEAQWDEEFKQLAHDFHNPLIKYGVMAEYARLKEVYKPLMSQYD
ncbi:MAG: helix-turn-helix transcriptional regulator [bacterium]|nr:helix-turn-helix transcriptional regulator [bacterium]